jgi:hypothetical protein
VLRETTSRGLCGLVCPPRTSERGGGTREEPGTLIQGAPVFPGSSRLGIEPCQTQNSRVAGARPNHQPIGGSDPNHQGIWAHPGRGYALPITSSHIKLSHFNAVKLRACQSSELLFSRRRGLLLHSHPKDLRKEVYFGCAVGELSIGVYESFTTESYRIPV